MNVKERVADQQYIELRQNKALCQLYAVLIAIFISPVILRAYLGDEAGWQIFVIGVALLAPLSVGALVYVTNFVVRELRPEDPSSYRVTKALVKVAEVMAMLCSGVGLGNMILVTEGTDWANLVLVLLLALPVAVLVVVARVSIKAFVANCTPADAEMPAN